jgi:hypothetical protein
MPCRTGITRIAGLLVLLTAAVPPLAAGECPKVSEHAPPRPPLQVLPERADQLPVDPAFEARVAPWRAYAQAIRDEPLRCEQQGDAQIWYRGHEQVRRHWPADRIDVYLRDGRPYYIEQLGSQDTKSWAFYEQGELLYVEHEVLGRFRFQHQPRAAPAD